MKKIFFILTISINLSMFSQELLNSGNLINAGIEDGAKLVEAYIEPINKAIVFGLSDVTYTKIKREDDKRLLLSVKMAYVSVPEEDLTFDVRKIGLRYFEPENPDKVMAQSVFGDSLKYITLVSKDKDLLGRPLISFDTPGGGQTKALPLPFIGATYRLKHTNLSFNLIPYISIPGSDLKIGMLGVSVQQDLAMFIESMQDKPLGISLQGGGAFLFGNAALDVVPGGIVSPVTITGNPTGPYDNQEVNISYSSFNFAAYVDYTIKEKFTFFAGGGVNTGTANIDVTGRYPVYTTDPSGFGSVVAEDIDDPLSISSSFSRLKFEIGARADFNRFFLQINYNMANYGGLGMQLGYKMF